MIRIAIVDDEMLFCEHVQQVVNNFFRPVTTEYSIKIYNMPRELLWDIQEGQYFDIYLLDIEMPVVNGFRLAYEIRVKYEDPYIIFLTSHLEYILEGYKYKAWRFITKDKMDVMVPEALGSLLSKFKTKTDRLYMIESYSRVTKFAFKDIYYLRKDGKYTIFHTKQGVFKDRKGINKVLEILQDEAFVFTDRSFVVNMRHVVTFEDHFLIMRDGKEVPISIPQYANVRKALIEYWREGNFKTLTQDDF